MDTLTISAVVIAVLIFAFLAVKVQRNRDPQRGGLPRRKRAKRPKPKSKEAKKPKLEPTWVGADIGRLLGAAAHFAVESVAEQKDAFEKKIPTRKRNTNDPAMRFAVDDFIVGYTIGQASTFIQRNVVDTPDILMSELLSRIQVKLNEHFPKIDAEKSYREDSARFKCGYFFGSREPGRNEEPITLNTVWGLMDPHDDAGGIGLSQFAYENFDSSIEEGYIIQAAGNEMLERRRSLTL